MRQRDSRGEMRDAALIRESARLNRCLARESSVEPVTLAPAPRVTTTIPPPAWKRA
jgi:hypothetical protein